MISRRTLFLGGTAAVAMGSAMSLFGRKPVEAKETAYPVTHTDEEWRKLSQAGAVSHSAPARHRAAFHQSAQS